MKLKQFAVCLALFFLLTGCFQKNAAPVFQDLARKSGEEQNLSAAVNGESFFLDFLQVMENVPGAQNPDSCEEAFRFVFFPRFKPAEIFYVWKTTAGWSVTYSTYKTTTSGSLFDENSSIVLDIKSRSAHINEKKVSKFKKDLTAAGFYEYEGDISAASGLDGLMYYFTHDSGSEHRFFTYWEGPPNKAIKKMAKSFQTLARFAAQDDHR